MRAARRLAAVVVVAASMTLALLGGVPGRAAAAPDSTWIDHLNAARTALARNDLDAARPHLLLVDSIVGGHPGAMNALATIAARRGDRAEALRWLRDLAANGLARGVARDTNFASLAGDPEFQAIVARFDSNAAPIANARVAFTLGDSTLLAEDVAYDARGRRFLVSSIHRRKIVSVDSTGRVRDFVPPGAKGVWGIYALALDSKRGRLWATTAAGPVSEGYQPADVGRTAILAYDLRNGRTLDRIELPRRAERLVLGDLTLGADGTLYATASVGGGVYRLLPGAASLDTLAPAGTFLSPQTPAVAADGRLLIADYPRGIASLDPRTGRIDWLRKPHSLATGGIDGLYRDGDRLIAIQNGTAPRRVIEMTLDAGANRITAWRVLEQATPQLGEPNHGVVVGRDFYFIGNSGWDVVDDREEFQVTRATPPVLLRLSLDGKSDTPK